MICLQVSDAVSACLASDKTEHAPGTRTINTLLVLKKNIAVVFSLHLLYSKK